VVNEWTVDITRDLQPIMQAGYASDAVRYEMGPAGIEIKLTGNAPFSYGDVATQTSHWVGHQLQQRPYVLQAAYGLVTSAQGGGNRTLIIAGRSGRLVKASSPDLMEGSMALDFEFDIIKHTGGVPQLVIGTI
jgi:hypothetical protein